MGEERERFTPSGIPIKTVYDARDIKGIDPEEKLGEPGKFPFTRGVYPEMYRKRLWTMRQYAGFGTAEETNARFKYLIKLGQTGLSLAFDLPTQLGLDSDHEMAKGEIGRTGVAVSTVDDLKEVFKDVDLSKISTSMTINATAPVLLSMYLIIAESQGVSADVLRGTVQNDILKEFVARGNYIYPVKRSIRLVGDLIEFCVKHMPKWNPISVSGYHYREAGATAVEEAGFTLSCAIAYVEEVVNRGYEVDSFAPRISFFFASHSNFFEEIAKFRAVRRVWANIMKNRFNAKKTSSMRLRFHTQTGGVTLTSIEPMNNIVRVTLQALSAVLGGTQSLHTNSFDEALSLPTNESARLALRTQQIIAFETGIPDTVDPLGGSYFIESLTNEIEEKILALIDEIDSIGGAVAAIEKKFMQNRILKSAYEHQKLVESGNRVIVGVNRFLEEKPKKTKIKIFKLSQEIEEKQISRLRMYKSSRNSKDLKTSLKNLKDAAKTNKNLIPFIIDALKSKATLGEISDSLKEVFGEYEER